jgi:hypothetical protein
MYTCTYPRRIQKPLHRLLFVAGLLVSSTAFAAPFVFSTGTVTNSIATASRPGPAFGANQETESADDFLLGASAQINSATFTGLLPAGVTPSDVSQVVIEIYRVFPNDSDTARTGFPVPPFSTAQVPARQNSPSDVEFAGRDSAAAQLTFNTTPLPTFTGASNSVDLGIHPKPGFNTGGDGPVTRMQEVQFNVTFSDPIDLPAGHYFFVPQVLLSNPDEHFLWLSASRPIDATGTPFAPDLQSWIRNAGLDPDWLRIGTDIVGGTTFNAAFTLAGTVPEPATLALLCVAFAGIGVARRRTQH